MFPRLSRPSDSRDCKDYNLNGRVRRRSHAGRVRDRCRSGGGHVNRRAPASTFERQKEEEEEDEAQVVRRGVKKEEKKKKKEKVPVFSQGLLTDTKSVFVCLPGCQIKEFLCVGGSDRVYLTLQPLLSSKCPTVNAGHESHLALDRGSLFSGERGSCLEKIFNRRGVGAGGCRYGGGLCSLCCIQTYSGALCPALTIERILYYSGSE